jgi:corrinoid protein of di/trimethylamine methyltransferase
MGGKSGADAAAAAREAVLNGQKQAAADCTGEALAAGIEPSRLLEDHLVPAIRQAGDRWEAGDYFLPELVRSAEAMHAALALIKPAVAEGTASALSRGRVIVGTVKGDIHDIGKTLVGSFLGAVGFEVRDLGVDISAEQFVREAKSFQAELIGLSALLTTTMPEQRRTIEALEAEGLRGGVKVLVGGAPVTAGWAAEIGADGYAENAAAAATLAEQLLATDRGDG